MCGKSRVYYINTHIHARLLYVKQDNKQLWVMRNRNGRIVLRVKRSEIFCLLAKYRIYITFLLSKITFHLDISFFIHAISTA